MLIVRRIQAAQLNQQKSLYEAVFDQRLSATGEHIRQFLYYLEQVIARRDDMSPPRPPIAVDLHLSTDGSAVRTALVAWPRHYTPQVSLTATDGGATTSSAIHCWTPSIRCALPHGLELLAGRPPRTAGL